MISKLIKKKRKENGYTQEQLAEKAGRYGNTISNWENGKTCPAESDCIKLAQIFICDVVELLCARAGIKYEPAAVTEVIVEKESRLLWKRYVPWINFLLIFCSGLIVVGYIDLDITALVLIGILCVCYQNSYTDEEQSLQLGLRPRIGKCFAVYGLATHFFNVIFT